MKKCCFIIPYFGKLPNYFEVFAKSCSRNVDYQWLIFTDDPQVYNVPSNVVIHQMSFDDFFRLLDSKFDFPVEIRDYHKICDLKPAFGYLFEDYIRDFEFWGYCDLDTVFGDLNAFITPEILKHYDKLFCLGHCVLFRNTFENNRLFMKPVKGEYWYKESFSTPITTVFDETFGGDKNVNTLFKYYGKKVLEADWAFNCNIAPANLQRIAYVPSKEAFEVEKYKPSIFTWNDGKILRYYRESGKLHVKEYMYMHFQSRAMSIDNDILNKNCFKIMGDGFYELELPVTNNNFRKIKHTIFSVRKIKMIARWKFDGLKRRLKK